MNKKSLDYEKWIRKNRLYHFCIEDLKNLETGDVIDVAIFDRNGRIWHVGQNSKRKTTKAF